MENRNPDNEQTTIEKHADVLANELNLSPEVVDSVTRDRSAVQPTRKPSSDDVETERIAAAQQQNAEQDGQMSKKL